MGDELRNNLTKDPIVYYIYINILVGYTGPRYVVTLISLLQICKLINRHATLQSQALIVKVRTVFSFRK